MKISLRLPGKSTNLLVWTWKKCSASQFTGLKYRIRCERSKSGVASCLFWILSDRIFWHIALSGAPCAPSSFVARRKWNTVRMIRLYLSRAQSLATTRNLINRMNDKDSVQFDCCGQESVVLIFSLLSMSEIKQMNVRWLFLFFLSFNLQCNENWSIQSSLQHSSWVSVAVLISLGMILFH